MLCNTLHPEPMPYPTICLVLLVLLGLSCKDPTAPEPVRSVVSCSQPNGQLIQCDLLLEERGGFTITLTSRECQAEGNTLTLTKPIEQVLSDDACTAPVGGKWQFPGPYPVGTPVSLAIVSAKQRNPPSLLATGSYPRWTLTFEDGVDRDFDDLVLRLEANPSP